MLKPEVVAIMVEKGAGCSEKYRARPGSLLAEAQHKEATTHPPRGYNNRPSGGRSSDLVAGGRTEKSVPGLTWQAERSSTTEHDDDGDFFARKTFEVGSKR